MRARERSGDGRRRRDRGTVLMLMPAAVLVLVVLGAIAVDSAVVFMAQRNLVAAAGDASNDAGALAFRRSSLYQGGAVQLDRSAVGRTVAAVLSREGVDGAKIESVRISADGHQATVVVSRRVDLIFAPVVPGVSHSRMVRATVTVTDVDG